MLHAHRFKTFFAALHVLIGVEVGNVGHAHDDSIGVAVLQEPLQIAYRQSIVLSRVDFVNLRIHILDVNDIAVQNRVEGLQIFERHIEAGFSHNLPLVSAKFPKLLNEFDLQHRFAAAERDAAFGRQKIELVDFHLLEKLFGRIKATFFGFPRSLVEAIFAAQRTAAERHQSGDALAVRGQAVAADAEDACSGHLKHPYPSECPTARLSGSQRLKTMPICALKVLAFRGLKQPMMLLVVR